MPIEQKIFSVIVGLSILIIIFELIRRRKLREEYSWFWILTGLVVFLLSVLDPLVLFIMSLVKAKAATSVVYMLGIIFLLLLNLHFSISISNLKTRIKELTQKIALLETECKEKLRNKFTLTESRLNDADN